MSADVCKGKNALSPLRGMQMYGPNTFKYLEHLDLDIINNVSYVFNNYYDREYEAITFLEKINDNIKDRRIDYLIANYCGAEQLEENLFLQNQNIVDIRQFYSLPRTVILDRYILLTDIIKKVLLNKNLLK